MSETTDAKSVVLTLTIYPPKNGKRAVLVTGAPEGEMPEIRRGLFADRHRLLDEVFTALLKRKPQVVKVKPPAKRADMIQEAQARMADHVGAGGGSEGDDATNLVASGDGDTPAPPEIEGDTPPADLPVIENDQLALPLLDAAEPQAEEVTHG